MSVEYPSINDREFDLLKKIVNNVAAIGGGGGGTGDVVGPASSTSNAIVRWNGLTGKLQKDSSVIISDTGDVTITLGQFLQEFDAVVDKPIAKFSGTWFTGGTSTTTKPAILIEPDGTTSTNWSTNGTAIGINAATGFLGNFIDFQLNGAARFSVSKTGLITSYGPISIGDGYGTANAIGSLFGYAGVENGGFITYGTFTAKFFTNTIGNGHLRGDSGYGWEVRNGTNASVFKVYKTWTNDSNYERIAMTGNAITVETAGTGADNIDMTLTAAGTGNIKMGSPVALNNAAVAETPTATHTLILKDSGGVAYRVLCVV